MTSVTEAVARRRSVRPFLDTPVDLDLLRDIIAKATRAPSGGNLQPWRLHVVAGEALARLKVAAMASLARSPLGEGAEYAIYPERLADPHRARRFAVGEAMYAHIGIPRGDKAARMGWFARNFQFFGAPAAWFVTVDRGMGPPQWADLGMYLQNLMLLSVEAGLATCPQECWAMYPDTVTAFLGTPPERMLFCGVAVGYEDPDEPANRLRSERAPEAEWLSVVG